MKKSLYLLLLIPAVAMANLEKRAKDKSKAPEHVKMKKEKSKKITKLRFQKYTPTLIDDPAVSEIFSGQKLAKKIMSRNQPKNIDTFSYEELKTRRAEVQKKDDQELEKAYVLRMIELCTEAQEMRQLRLALADLHFTLGELEDAAEKYTEFVTLYPSSDKVGYARYRAISALYNQILDLDRDQTKTKAVIEQAEQFLKNKQQTEFREEVEKIYEQANLRLFESEMNVLKFYLQQEQLEQAQERYTYIKATMLPRISAIAPQAAQELEDRLAAGKEGVTYEAKMAQKQGKKRESFGNRF